MTLEHSDADHAPGPTVEKIGARLTPPLVEDVKFLRSVGYKDTEVVRRGVAMLAIHERQIRRVQA